MTTGCARPTSLSLLTVIVVVSVAGNQHIQILCRPLVQAVFVEQTRSLPSCRVSEQASSFLWHSHSPGEFLPCCLSSYFSQSLLFCFTCQNAAKGVVHFDGLFLIQVSPDRSQSRNKQCDGVRSALLGL